MDINVIIASTVGLFVITLLLVTMLLFAKAKLLPSGPVKLIINGEKNVEVNSGDTLLTTLGNNKIFLPSACGGGGTCVQCKCQVVEGGGEILPTEEPHFTRKEISEGWRLGCQVKVKQDMKIEVPEEGVFHLLLQQLDIYIEHMYHHLHMQMVKIFYYFLR
jgi:Na+-transporting NADH:ubiquinone oxidoreductase subunit F